MIYKDQMADFSVAIRLKGIKNANKETNRKLLLVFTQLMIVEGEPVAKMVLFNKGLDVRAMEYFSHRLDSMVVHFPRISNIRGVGYFMGWMAGGGGGKVMCL